MTKMTPLLERNEQFAAAYTPGPLGPPAAQAVIVTCLDHRVDPAITLGLQLGDAVVIRNTGGRVTPAVIEDIAYLGFLAGQLFSGIVAAEGLFEVAVVHHTQCGTGFLADPGFRHQAAEATGQPEAALEAGRRPGGSGPGPGADRPVAATARTDPAARRRPRPPSETFRAAHRTSG
jgi:carbonic anhydrase